MEKFQEDTVIWLVNNKKYRKANSQKVGTILQIFFLTPEYLVEEPVFKEISLFSKFQRTGNFVKEHKECRFLFHDSVLILRKLAVSHCTKEQKSFRMLNDFQLHKSFFTWR